MLSMGQRNRFFLSETQIPGFPMLSGHLSGSLCARPGLNRCFMSLQTCFALTGWTSHPCPTSNGSQPPCRPTVVSSRAPVWLALALVCRAAVLGLIVQEGFRVPALPVTPGTF